LSDHQRVSTGGRTLPGGGGWIWKQMHGRMIESRSSRGLREVSA